MSIRITVPYNSSPLRTLDLGDDFLSGMDEGSLVKLMVKQDSDDEDEDALLDLEGTVAVDEDTEEVSVSFQFTPAETAGPAGTWPGQLRVWKDGDDAKPPDDAESVDFEITEAIDLP